MENIKYDAIREQIENSIEVKKLLLGNSLLIQKINDLVDNCTKVLRAGGKVIFFGNGGSFADAQHLSAEFTSRFLFDRPGLASIALGTNSSAMTAIGNDYGYEDIFSREIEAIATPNDILIAITTSGKSSNIIKASTAAKAGNVPFVVLTGNSRGDLDDDVKTIHVPSSETARIQECHILIGHIVCGLVEKAIFTK